MVAWIASSSMIPGLVFSPTDGKNSSTLSAEWGRGHPVKCPPAYRFYARSIQKPGTAAANFSFCSLVAPKMTTMSENGVG